MPYRNYLSENLDCSQVEFQSQILEQLSTAIVVCNRNLQIVFANAAAQTLLEIGEKQVEGELVFKYVTQADIEPIADRALSAFQATTLRRIDLVATNHQQKFVDCTLTPTLIGDTRYLVFELNEINKVVQQLEESTMEVGQFANLAVVRAIAHEIKNPLGGLRGAAQLLTRELGNQPNMKSYTEIIVRETDRLCGLVDSMSHIQAPAELAAVNIHEVLEHVYRLASTQVAEDFKISRDYDPSLPPVLGDFEQLVQAFVNIVQNAIEAAGPAGEIKLKTRAERQVTLGKARQRYAARIDIEDNGCGIPDEISDRIFYPMISGKPQGEGLGLSIVHQIITRHGGSIQFDTRPGHTTFTIVLKFATLNGHLETSTP